MSQRKGSRSPNKIDPEARKQEEEVKKKMTQVMQNRNKKSQGIFEKYGYHIVIGGFLAMCAIAILTTLFRASTKLSQIPVNDQREIERHNLAGHSFKLGETEMFHVLFFSFFS